MVCWIDLLPASHALGGRHRRPARPPSRISGRSFFARPLGQADRHRDTRLHHPQRRRQDGIVPPRGPHQWIVDPDLDPTARVPSRTSTSPATPDVDFGTSGGRREGEDRPGGGRRRPALPQAAGGELYDLKADPNETKNWPRTRRTRTLATLRNRPRCVDEGPWRRGAEDRAIAAILAMQPPN